MPKKIKLTQNKYAIVDDSDFEWLNQWKWHYSNKGYAKRNILIATIHGKQKFRSETIHQLIMKTPKGMDTDHINRDRLDNRRENLRIATRSENKRNSNVYKNNKVGQNGVSFIKKTGLWRVRIQIEKKRISLGCFTSLEEAIKARILYQP